MSNDYFKAQGWFKDYARNSQDSRGMFQRLVKEDEEAFKLASAETDKIKAMINKKYGPGTMKYGSEISQPPQRPDVIEIDAINAFMKRNPAADGGKIIGKPGGLVEPGVKYYGVSLREGDLLNPYRVTLKTSEGQIDQHFATETEAYEFYDKKEAEALEKGTKSRASTRYITKLATEAMNEYNKIIDHAVNNRKVKNFSEPFEIVFKDKKYTFTEIPTIKDFMDKVNPNQPNHLKLKKDYFTKYGVKPALTKENAFIKIVNNTVKLNNDTFTFSTVDDIAEDIGYKKGRPGGVIDLFEGNKIIKPFNKDEIVSKYIQHLVDKDAPLKDFTSESIFRHVNNRRNDLIKKNKDSSLSIPGTKRTIEAKNISKIMKADHPELFAKLGRDGQIPFLSRSIQNKSDLGNLKLSEAFQTTESGDIFFNEAKAKNINLKKALANITAETDILQGKLKLDQKSLAISNAQDKMVEDLNKYIRENPNVILDNPQFRNLAATRFEDGKFIIDEDPKLINDRLNRYIKRGFFSTDHKVSKRTGKLNIEFPTNKQIVPTFINGPIRSMENYIANNISKYDTDPLIKNNIDEIVNVAKTNNFTVNVPKGNSKIFGTNRTNVGAIADIATVSADGTVLTSYDNQLKKFNFDIDKIPELSNVKNIDYTEVDKSKLQKTLDTKLTTAKGYIDYIDGQGGTTLSSGFNTDLLMKDPAVQKILNSKAGQAVKNAARGTAGTVGKAFGVADILIGVLDYENNISKGQKPDEALGNAVQAMSFGLYKSGDRARIEDVKERFVAKGGDGEIFDQATALNAKDQEINDLIYKSKFTADKAFMDLSQPQAILGKSVDQRKQDYEILKQSLNEKIRDKIAERDGMIESYKTNLRVSEAGAPIDIGGKEFFSQPFKDIRAATMEKIREENRKAYDMQKRQVNFTSGNIGNWLQNNIFTMSPLERAELQKQINNMDERELYRFNLQRGMDPDNLIRFEDILNYKMTSPELMGVNTTKYINKRDRNSEGGITGLRSKYEYKK